jgi:hypothetical protein
MTTWRRQRRLFGRIAVVAYLCIVVLLAFISTCVILSDRSFPWLEKIPERSLALELRSLQFEYDRAVKLLERDKPAEAAVLLEALFARLSPVRKLEGRRASLRSRVLMRLGEAYQQQGKRRSADSAYQRLLLGSPADPGVHVLFGRVLLESGRDAEGEDMLLKSLNLNPSETAASESLISHYCDKGRFDDAIEIHERYQHAFLIMQHGVVRLRQDDQNVGSLTFLPVCDGVPHEYVLPVARLSTRKADATVSALAIEFEPGPACGYVVIHSIRIVPYRSVLGPDNSPAVVLSDFSRAECSGIVAEPDDPSQFRVSRPGDRVSLVLALTANGIRLEDLDRIEIRMSAFKTLSDQTGLKVEQALIARVRDVMREGGQK